MRRGDGCLRKQVGIRDVAAAAGVSVTTFRTCSTTPRTRGRATRRGPRPEPAAQLGYHPNRLARGLRTQASGMVGLLTEEIATTPHAGRIILGAQEAASRATSRSPSSTHDSGPIRQIKAPRSRRFIDRQVDGIIYATMYHRDRGRAARRAASPSRLC